MVASESNGQQMEAQSKEEREQGVTTIINLAPQQPTTSQHSSVSTAYITHFLLPPTKC